MNRRGRLIGSGLILLALGVGLAWLLMPPEDLLFHGKSESEWMAEISKSGNGAREQFREMGPEGVRFLGRLLDHGNTAGQRAYRRFYRFLPAVIAKRLPHPVDRSWDRLTIVWILSGLGPDAVPAEPSLARAIRDPDANGVAMSAVDCFSRWGFVRLLDSKTKAARVADLLWAFDRGGIQLTNHGDFSLRCNAARALAEFPEHSAEIVPKLAEGLSDTNQWTRIEVLHALLRLDPDAAIKAGAVTAALDLLDCPEGLIARRSDGLLARMVAKPDVCVPVLLDAAQNGDPQLASPALLALGLFPDQAETIIPVLNRCLANSDARIRRAALDTMSRITDAATKGETVK